MKKIVSYLFGIVVLLSACSAIPKKATQQELNYYSTIQSLIESKLKLPAKYIYTGNDYADLVQPHSYAVDYCLNQSGAFNKVKEIQPLPVPVRLPTTVSSSLSGGNFVESSSAVRDREATININNALGEFECVVNGTPIWGINITHSGPKLLPYTLYETVISVEYLNKVQIAQKKANQSLTFPRKIAF